jgi:galactose mutarotase-like enzyme
MTSARPAIEQHRFRGDPAITLRAGELAATFVPGVGMTGVSIRYRDREHLALPGGLDALRAGRTAGLPLLAPWANRLAARRYRAAGVAVDLRGLRLGTDDNGLPIHGLLVGKPGWRVDRLLAEPNRARLVASTDVDAKAFPFPHRLKVSVSAYDGRLVIDTELRPTGRRRVPVAFGWHPYLRLPGTPRARWSLRLPSRTHLDLDARGIPNGSSERERSERAPIGRRTFDDLYALGRDHRLAFEADDGSAIELHCGTGYEYAQVWVPSGRTFAALEPMTVPTNALERGATPLVNPGKRFVARFALVLRAPGSSA